MQTSTGSRGEDGGAHSGSVGASGELGGVLWTTNWRGRSAAPEVEDEVGDSTAERPGLRLLRGQLHGIEADSGDSTGRRGDGCGRENYGGASMAASAMGGGE